MEVLVCTSIHAIKLMERLYIHTMQPRAVFCAVRPIELGDQRLIKHMQNIYLI